MTSQQQTSQTLRAYAAAWASGDGTSLLNAYADDVVFHYYGDTDLAGTHVGKQASITAMIAASTRSKRELIEIVDVLSGETLGAIVARERFTRDDQVTETQRVLLYRVEADKIVECWLYDESQRAIDQFWQS